MKQKPPPQSKGNQSKVLHTRQIHAPHDKLFKYLLKDIAIAKDFLEIHLPPTLKPYCNLSTLRISDTSYIEDDYAAYLSDILYQAEIQGEPGYLYCLIEHVSHATPLIPFQILKYQVSILQQHLLQLPSNKRKTAKLPIVVPLLFYRGEKSPYPYSTNVLDCFQSPELAKTVLVNPYHLIDLSIIPDEELKRHKSIALLELIQKHIHIRDALVYRLKDWLEKDHLHQPLSIQQFGMMIRYALEEGWIKEVPLLVASIKNSNIEREYKDAMLTAAHYFRQEGIQQGVQQGIQEAKESIAKEMLRQGLEDSLIISVTGLPKQIIDTLR